MDIIISFFRDGLSGWFYLIYLIICLILILAIIGFLGDKKKQEIREQIKNKKKQDLISGEAAARASLEGKQIINVVSEETPKVQPREQPINISPVNPVSNVPPILGIDSNSSIVQNESKDAQTNQEKTQPLVINGDLKS